MKARFIYAFFLLLLAFLTHHSKAQTASFTLPVQACLGEQIELNNTSAGSTRYLWDFCQNGLGNLKAGTVKVKNVPTNIPVGLEIKYDKGNWYGFACSRDNHKLIRLDFGNSLSNTAASVSSFDYGDFSGKLQGPSEIRLIQFGGNWFGFIANYHNSNLVRIDFGISLNNPSPSAVTLGNLDGWNGLYGLDIVNDNGNYMVLVTSNSSNTISVINFTNTLFSASPIVGAVSTINATVSTLIQSPVKIEVQKAAGNWYALFSSLAGKIVKLDFGSSLLTTPIVSEVAAIPDASALRFKKDGLNFFAFVQNITGNLYTLNFGTDITTTPLMVNNGNFGGVGNIYGLDVVKEWPNWKGFFIGVFSNDIYRIDFDDNCTDVFVQSSIENTPTTLSYSTAGQKLIELAAYAADGTMSVDTKEVLINNLPAPQGMINTNAVCVQADVDFSISITNGLTINSWDWDFDNGQTSAAQNPAKQFASARDYETSVIIGANNGCTNLIKKTVSIFNSPIADFSLPTNSPLCTNQLLLFNNSTTYDAGSTPEWKWLLDGLPVSTSANLESLFTNTASSAITLVASLPGCQSQVVKTLGSLLAGPQVDFFFTGVCEKTQIQFTSDIKGMVTGHTWDFDDGNTSTEDNPGHVFSNSGEFSVVLSASGTNGCNNTSTKKIIIYSKANPDFQIGPPPLSCSGSSTPFADLTHDPSDSDITSWQWNFGESGSTNTSIIQNPAHTFAVSGDYTVSLTTTTNVGCSSTKQKVITIAPSPVAAISNTTVCNNLPITFSTPTAGVRAYYWEMGTAYYETATPTHTFTVPANYPVKLTATGDNGCITIVTKNIPVPVPLAPDFSVRKNCVGTDAVFTDITTGIDPVVTRVWDFAGVATATGSPATFLFNALGSKSIKLAVTAQSGCTYSKSKLITIVTPPKADFTMTPETGAAPLSTQFTNASVSSTQYLWSFQDGGPTSAAASPLHVFKDLGDHSVELTASNAEGCESKINKTVTVVAPLPDIDLKLLTVSENQDGTLKVIITIQNKGNTFVENLPISIDLSGNVSLKEIIKSSIAPAALYNFVLSYAIIKTENVNFLCASAELQNDLAPADNRICTDFENETIVFSAYPNPVRDELHIEWIAAKDKIIDIHLVDSFGKTVLQTNVSSNEGLNQSLFSTNQLQSGIYLLVLKEGAVQKTQRIFVSGQN
jgi:PKD repeat protein